MSQTTSRSSGNAADGGRNRTVIMVLAWAWVTIPFLYGVIVLATKLPALF